MELKAFVEKASNTSYSCCAEQAVGNCLLVGYGKSAREAIEDFYVSYSELKEMNAERGQQTPDIQVSQTFDVGSLFNYYNFLSIEGMARISGIKASVLRQYASGVRRPKPERLSMLEDGLRIASQQLNSVVLRA